MNSANFISGNRSIGLNQFHLEWCPKYRKAVLYGSVRKIVENSLIETACKYKIIIHDLHVSDDHVHLFASLPFDMSISKTFQLLKGRSAYDVFIANPELRTILRKGHFWSPGKFCRSISNVKSETIRGYIRNHQFKELNQSIHEARTEAEQLKLSSFF